MKPLFYESECNPQVNARIMKVVEETVCKYRSSLPNGWRVVIKFQRKGEQEPYFTEKPYYHLDLQSNHGGGDYAPVKMQALELFPKIGMTGRINPVQMVHVLDGTDIDDGLFRRLIEMSSIKDLTEADWDILKKYGLTHWYGGIRIPYDILVTEHNDGLCVSDDSDQSIRRTEGEVRIAFSGAKEWQDVFFALRVFCGIQLILEELWDADQIWWNLRGLQKDPVVGFWLNNMGITEVLPIWS